MDWLGIPAAFLDEQILLMAAYREAAQSGVEFIFVRTGLQTRPIKL